MFGLKCTQPRSPSASPAAIEVVWVPPSSSGSAVAPSAHVSAEPVVPSAGPLTSAAAGAAPVVVDGVIGGLAGVASVLAAAAKDNNIFSYIPHITTVLRKSR